MKGVENLSPKSVSLFAVKNDYLEKNNNFTFFLPSNHNAPFSVVNKVVT